MLIGVYLRSSAAINDFFTPSEGAVAGVAPISEEDPHSLLSFAYLHFTWNRTMPELARSGAITWSTTQPSAGPWSSQS